MANSKLMVTFIKKIIPTVTKMQKWVSQISLNNTSIFNVGINGSRHLFTETKDKFIFAKVVVVITQYKTVERNIFLLQTLRFIKGPI